MLFRSRTTRARARAEAIADDLARREAAQTSRRVTRSARLGEAMLAKHDADAVGGHTTSKENPNRSMDSRDNQMDDTDDESSQQNDLPDMLDASEEEASDDEDDREDDAPPPMDDDSDKKVEEETSGTTNTRLLDRYNQYAPENRFVAPLEARDLTGVRLLRVLKSKKAALNSYNELFEWHLREIGALKEGDGMRLAENR